MLQSPRNRYHLAHTEREFILKLSEFGGSSPRRLKRFINLYRVIRSTLTEEEVTVFLGDSGGNGDYGLVLVLLAVLTGSPSVSVEVLGKLQQPSTPLSVIVSELKKGDGAEQRSSAGALALLPSEYQTGSAVLRRWASVVGRYSFRP